MTGKITLFFCTFCIGLWLCTIQSRSTVYAAPDLTNIVNQDVEEFVIHNGHIYYTICYGDAGLYGVQFMRQAIVGGSAEILATVNGNSACDARDLQTDGLSLFYIKPSEQIIERRVIGAPTVTLTIQQYFSYNEPNDLTYHDGFLYWAAENDKIYRDNTFGNAEIIFANTVDEPTAIDVDEKYVWWGSSSGLYQAELDCATPCSDSTPNYGDPIGRIFAASDAVRTSVFWIGDYAAPTLESYDCDIPDTSGCFHKDLYTAPSTNVLLDLVASDGKLFWSEVIDNSSIRLRRIERDGSGGAVNIVVNQSVGSDFSPIRKRNLLGISQAHVYLQHDGVSRERVNATPITWNIVPFRMTVTQGSQNANNEVPLVADKPTYVLVQARLPDGPSMAGLEAQLAGTVNNVALPGSPLQPVRRPSNMLEVNLPAHGSLQNGWLFELPPSWTAAGSVRLAVTTDPRKLYDTLPNTAARTVTFNAKPPICVVALRVRTHAPKPSTTMANYGFAVAQGERMLPASAIWRYKQGGLLEEGIWPFYSPYELPDDRTKILQNLWWHDQLSDDPDECDDAGARTLYMGIVHPDTDTGTLGGIAYRDQDQLWVKLPYTGNAWGVNFAGWPISGLEPIVAHEMGHNFGRKHTDCNDPDDPGFYPYPPNQIEDSSPIDETTHFGFESVREQIIGPTGAADVMSYCGPQWTSDFTWRAIFNELGNTRDGNRAAEQQAAATAVTNAASIVLVSGVVETQSLSGTLGTAWTMPSTSVSREVLTDWGELAAESAEHAATVQIRFNVVLGTSQTYNITPQEMDDEFSSTQWFGASFPRPSGLVTSIDLLMNGVVVDSLAPGAVIPQTTLELPAGGEVATSQLLARWTASDSEPLTFSIHYSPDNGATWRVVAHNLRNRADGGDEYEVMLDTTDWAGSNGQNGLLRIVSSDGINTSLRTSNSFTVPNRTPDVYIDAPIDGQIFPAGATISVRGQAVDPEDGVIDSADLNWTLNGSSVGAGAQLSLTGLAPGAYTLVGRAADNTRNATGSHTITFHVAPLRMGKGAAVLDGRCLDANYSEGDTVPLERYSDGSQAVASFTQSDDYLYVCFSGLRNGTFNEYAGVRIDGNGSGEFYAQSGDYRFEVYPDGRLLVLAGDGSGGFAETVSAYIENTFSAEVSAGSDSGTWNAELRIERGMVFIAADVSAITVEHSWVDSQGDDYYWPHDAGWRNPNTWATSHLKRTPQVASIAPSTIALPSDALWLTIEGSDFEPNDKMIWDGQEMTTIALPSIVLGYVPTDAMTVGEHVVTVRSDDSADNIESSPLIVHVTSPAPAITTVSPTQVIEGSGSHTLTVNGTEFMNGATVLFDGSVLATTFVNSTQLQATLPAAETAFGRAAQIRVQNPEPVQAVSNGVDFNVDAIPTHVTMRVLTAGSSGSTIWLWSMLALLLGLFTIQIRRRNVAGFG